MHAVDTLAPIFLVIFLGAILRRTGFFGQAAHTEMNRFSYWIGLPALLFLKTGQASPAAGSALMVAQIVLAVTGVLILVSLAGARLLRLRAAQIGSFVQAAFRGNLAFIGLPVVLFAFAGSPDNEAAQATAALALAPVVVAYNMAAVVALLLSERRFTMARIPRILLRMATNPLLIASALGLIWNAWSSRSGASLIPFAERALQLLGGTALPMALLCVGGALVSTPLHGCRMSALFASLIKTAVGPVVCILIAGLFGADPMERSVAAILCAAPTAISSYVLAGQLNGDTSLTAASIVASTLMSMVSLSIVVGLI